MMSHKKVVFIINSLSQQRCIKRIEEFISNGYEIEAYGFVRKDTAVITPKSFDVITLGEFDNSLNYFSRLVMMFNLLKPVFRKKRSEDTVFYYFMLDVAMVSRLLCNRPYVYEESDLMHSYIGVKPIRYLLDVIDKYLIKRSIHTVFTSDGFVKYHFGEKKPDNVSVIPNRLNVNILKLPYVEKTPLNDQKLRFAFVGVARYLSLVNFVDVLARNFPRHEFHFYGIPIREKNSFESLKKYENVYFHGKFLNPDDLPAIYSKIDLVVSTYDVKYINIRCLEPNKLYEAIYFETPIIVSEGTFLADRVKSLNIGFAVNPLDEESVVSFISNLKHSIIEEKQKACSAIPKEYCINQNDRFFQKIGEVI